jgi:VWFA-related protein
MRSRSLLGLAAVAVMLLTPAPLPMRAQQAPTPQPAAPPADQAPAPPTQPAFRVEANFVRVDVYPTNGKGEPVTDLTADDFEILEDNRPQKVTQFERVALSTTTAREERRDPVSADDGRRQAADPRRRVYVIFLDTWHTDFAGAVRARKPLVNMLERLIGPDDLFAVMTPDMDPRQITFARRTETIDDMLMKQTQWGMKESLIRIHPEEQQLEMCFPEGMPPRGCSGNGLSPQSLAALRAANNGIAAQLIRRRRENEVLDALEGLVRYLGGVREERKALITVTTGYQMFEPKEDLLRHEECASPPSMGGVGTGPDGRVTTNPGRAQNGPVGMLSSIDCATTAAKYARINNRQRFIALTQEANRYNVSFYPFDTRGLAAFDKNVGDKDERMVADRGEWYNKESGTQPGTMMGDRATLNVRLDSLRLLADNTDGLAIINTNNLDIGAARIVQDLSSYYLLGYYSANENLDGKWRAIKVRVKRPGVQVRARRGYRALRAEDMAAITETARADAAGGAGEAAAASESSLLAAALGSVGGIREGQPWRSRAAYFFHAGAGATTRTGRVWVTADLDPSGLRDASLAQGGTLSVTVTSSAGATVAQSELPLAAGARTVTAELSTTTAPLDAGDLLVRLRLTPTGSSLPLTDSARVSLPAADAPVGSPRLSRASPFTRQKFVPTADPRYRRNEKVRVEVPVAPGASAVKGELLDQSGKVMAAIPVTTAIVPPDDGGVGWATADVALVPLGAGDYVLRVEVTHPDGNQRSLTGFRVVP